MAKKCLLFSQENSIVDVQLGSKYASGASEVFSNSQLKSVYSVYTTL